jgi:hypothetical protein
MSPIHRTSYFALLYLTLCLLVAVNAVTFAQGGGVAIWSIAIQLAVITSALVRQSWSHVVVMIWAGICIIGVAAMWLAVLLRGSFSFPIGVVAYRTILMVLCFYLLVYAPTAFRPAPAASDSGNEA